MDTYKKDRDQELKTFQKEYDELKIQYTTFLTQAVHESDPSKQADLVKQILSINSSLAQHVREFIQNSRGKFDSDIIAKLTNDILQYQKEFEQIQKSSNKAQVLREILNKEKTELNALHEQFNAWLYAILGAILFLLVLIFRTSLVELSKSVAQQLPNISMTDSELTQYPDDSYMTSP